MTERQMISAYKREIKAKSGILPQTEGRSKAMQIAKLQDVWRRLQR